MTPDQILSEFKKEWDRAEARFPRFHSRHEGYAVIKEELDEVWDAVRQNDREQAMKEMIQVGAMALRFIDNLQNADL